MNQIRRRLTKVLVGGLVLAPVAGKAAEKFVNQAKDATQEELKDLQEQYERLDKRTKAIVRVVLFVSGLDLLAGL